MGANVRMAPTTHSKNTTAAVNADARRRGMTVESPEVLVDFILNGQLGIMTAPDAPDRRKLALVRGYLDVLLASQTRPAP